MPSFVIELIQFKFFLTFKSISVFSNKYQSTIETLGDSQSTSRGLDTGVKCKIHKKPI
jgi:hypothetical protein